MKGAHKEKKFKQFFFLSICQVLCTRFYYSWIISCYIRNSSNFNLKYITFLSNDIIYNNIINNNKLYSSNRSARRARTRPACAARSARAPPTRRTPMMWRWHYVIYLLYIHIRDSCVRLCIYMIINRSLYCMSYMIVKFHQNLFSTLVGYISV